MRAHLQRSQAAASKYQSVLGELQCNEHELALIQERINHSEHHAAEQSLQEMRQQVTQLETDLENQPEEKKRLEKAAKQLEKDIKNLDSSREDRIKQFEKQIAVFF